MRRALFQIHLWTGLGIGLYVIAISISGSVLVFRNDLYNAFTAKPLIVVPSGERLADEALRVRALAGYPGYEISRVWENDKNRDQAVEIVLERDGREKQRLFDPYTGQDLGNVVPAGIRLMSWLQDLHVNLLGGETGRLVNGGVSFLWIALGATGVLLWWPGSKEWRRSLWMRWNVNWRRFNWDLHSTLGIWTLPIFLLWGITGIHVSVPKPFWAVVDYFEPPSDDRPIQRVGDVILRWSARLHFGSFGGRVSQVAWVIIGLAPALLFITGAIMWWNRVPRRRGLA
jgi:uncharacterized iron-regulated membrane protein